MYVVGNPGVFSKRRAEIRVASLSLRTDNGNTARASTCPMRLFSLCSSTAARTPSRRSTVHTPYASASRIPRGAHTRVVSRRSVGPCARVSADQLVDQLIVGSPNFYTDIIFMHEKRSGSDSVQVRNLSLPAQASRPILTLSS